VPIVRCDRCRFSFEVKEEEEAAATCRQCGGPVLASDPAMPEPRPTAKTRKFPAVSLNQNKKAKDET
jgi:hypothetical protein